MIRNHNYLTSLIEEKNQKFSKVLKSAKNFKKACSVLQFFSSKLQFLQIFLKNSVFNKDEDEFGFLLLDW